MSKKVKLEIKNRFTGGVLFEYEKENNTLRDTITEAVKNDADLRDANLRGADLSDATVCCSDNEFDVGNRTDRFIYKTQLESIETEMHHDAKPCGV